MIRPSLTIVLLLIFMSAAGCAQPPAEPGGANGSGGDREAPPHARGADSGKAPGKTPADRTAGGMATGKYHRFQEFTLYVPDRWEVVPLEHFLEVPDRWELIPVPGFHFLYITYGDQSRAKARFCFQTAQDKEYTSDPFGDFKDAKNTLEERFRVLIQTDTVNLVEQKQMKADGFDVLWFHYSYSVFIERGDVVMKFLYKDGSFLSISGTFSAPMYSELREDIDAMLESIR